MDLSSSKQRLSRALVAALLGASAALAGPTADALDSFLAEARGDSPRAPGDGIASWADLRGGWLKDGTPIVSNRASIARLPEGLRTMLLHEAGRASIGTFPKAPATSHSVELELFAASPRQGGRVDVLVDDRIVARDVPVPQGRPGLVRVDLSEKLPVGTARVDARLSEGSPPVAVLGLKVRSRSGQLDPQAVETVRAAFQSHLSREPTVGELASAAPRAAEGGSFLGKFLGSLKGLFGESGPLTRREAVDFDFHKRRVTKGLKKRLERTPPEVLGVLMQRALAFERHSSSIKAVARAHKMVGVLTAMGIPTAAPEPPELDPADPRFPPDGGGYHPPMPPPQQPPQTPPADPAPPPADPAPPPADPAPPPADPAPPPADPAPPPADPAPPPADPAPPPADPEPPPADPEPPPADPEPPPADPAPPPGDEPDPNNIQIFDWYPLTVGTKMHYVDKADGDKEFTLHVEERTTYKGASVARIRRTDKNDEYDFISFDGALKLWLRHDDINGALDWSDDPVPFSETPVVKLGDRYEAIPKSYTNPATGGHFHWIIQFRDAFKDVKVPAGEFKNCLRANIKNVDTVRQIEISKFDMYLARGIGVVRRDGRFITTQFKHLLTSHEIAP